MATQKLATLLIGGAALLAGAGASYHYVVTVPKQHKQEEPERAKHHAIKIVKERIKQTGEESQRPELAECLTIIVNVYETQWDIACEHLSRPPNCPTLPRRWADSMARQLVNGETWCNKRHPLPK